MYTFLTSNPVFATILLVVVLALLVFLAVKLIRMIGLNKIQKTVYEEIRKAEKKYLNGENTQKFEHVVQLARSAIPSPFNIFITEKSVRKFIQLCFDLVKDYLDDNKLNGTGIE